MDLLLFTWVVVATLSTPTHVEGSVLNNQMHLELRTGCEDTPDWDNGSVYGSDCDDYRNAGACENDAIKAPYTGGEDWNFPEENCCDCGKTAAAETCEDGIQNQDETDIDCGGACSTCDPRYYAFDGCSTNPSADFNDDPPGYYDSNLEAAHIICCTLLGDSCSRKVDGNDCRSENNDDVKSTWEVARDHCEASGMRLCNSQGELDQCCRAGCGYDNLLIWSSMNEAVAEACEDGIMNQDETDIDCGGACSACVPSIEYVMADSGQACTGACVGTCDDTATQALADPNDKAACQEALRLAGDPDYDLGVAVYGPPSHPGETKFTGGCGSSIHQRTETTYRWNYMATSDASCTANPSSWSGRRICACQNE